ncbi:unnamed protein product [Protopolystoma xenopodis]|uniref:K Homology domain-containing protein n=1 Tax=Protopolystoma xenopodis TaxID=117903 RepID=A0A3S5AUQ1_9PLAT|nr:unnamed protein product [Protopolystoma xenopodis]
MRQYIYEAFPKVSVIWPDGVREAMQSNRAAATGSYTSQGEDIRSATSSAAAPGTSIVQLRGPRNDVNAASEILTKLVKRLIEENHTEEVILSEYGSSWNE